MGRGRQAQITRLRYQAQHTSVSHTAKSQSPHLGIVWKHWFPESGARVIRCCLPTRSFPHEPDPGQGLAATDSEVGVDLQRIWTRQGGSHKGDTGFRGKEDTAVDCQTSRLYETQVWWCEEQEAKEIGLECEKAAVYDDSRASLGVYGYGPSLDGMHHKEQCIVAKGKLDQFESHVRFFGNGALSAGGIGRPLESVSAMLTSLGARFPASYLIGPLAIP